MTQSATERLILRALTPVRDLLDSEHITEVLVNGHNQVFYEEAGRLHRTDRAFESHMSLETLLRLLAQNAGHVLHDSDFELDTAILGPPALRIHANFGATARDGVRLTLRRIAQRSLRLADLVERYRSLSTEAADFLRLAVALRRNILLSGGTGSGKTTLLRCLGDAIGEHERIVLIEDTAEIQFPQENVVSLLTRGPDRYGEGEVTLRDLFRSSLRLRPDRIVVGEVRGPEAYDLIQALSSGHTGSICTVHADSSSLALTRLEALALSSGVPSPPAVVRRQIAEVFSYVVQIIRLDDGTRKVASIDRLDGASSDGWVLRPVFALDVVSASRNAMAQPTGVGDPWLEAIPDENVQRIAPSLLRMRPARRDPLEPR